MTQPLVPYTYDAVATREQNAEWVRIYQANKGTRLGDWARDKLVRGNRRLVHKIVLKAIMGYPWWQTHFEDVYQEAHFGILKAIESFEPDRDIAFSTYAYHWIRHYCQIGLASTTIVHKPFMLWTIKRWCHNFETKYMNEHGIIPPVQLICDSLNATKVCINYVLTPEKYTSIKTEWFSGVTSLDALLYGDNDNLSLGGLLTTDKPEATLSENAAWLDDLIGGYLPWKLRKKECDLLLYRLQGLTVGESGDAMGLTYSQVRALNTLTMMKIRHALHQRATGETPTQYTPKKGSNERPSRGGTPKKRGAPKRKTHTEAPSSPVEACCTH